VTDPGAVPSAAAPVHHPVFARVFGRLAAAGERFGLAEVRGRLLADTAGRVLEVGAGSGSNFAHYPHAVGQVVAVEPEPHLRRLAEQAAGRAPVPVSVVDGVAEALPAGDREFDTAVVTLVLCSVADQPRALAELHRVLRPGGRLVLWEHVRAERPPLTIVQDALDRTVWPLVSGGCHVGRDTAAAITAAGFTVERLERRRMLDTRIPLPMAPHIIGTARRR
jgi:ubiquinone/menaquinone biosynthesis C-methylase UbiE